MQRNSSLVNCTPSLMCLSSDSVEPAADSLSCSPSKRNIIKNEHPERLPHIIALYPGAVVLLNFVTFFRKPRATQKAFLLESSLRE